MFALSRGAVCSCRCSRCAVRAVRAVRCCSGLRIIDPMLRHRCFKTIQFCLKNGIEASLPRHLLGIEPPLPRHLPGIKATPACRAAPPEVGIPTSLSHRGRNSDFALPPRSEFDFALPPRSEFRLRPPTKVEAKFSVIYPDTFRASCAGRPRECLADQDLDI